MFIYSVLSVWCRFAIYKNAVLLSSFLATGGADVNETVPFEARIGGFLCSRYFRFSGGGYIAPLVNIIEDT